MAVLPALWKRVKMKMKVIPEKVDKERLMEIVGKNSYLGINNGSAYYDIIKTLPEKGCLLEIGTGAGHSATFFAYAKPEWIIYTIDSYKVASDYMGAYDLNSLGEFVKNWQRHGLYNILPIINNSFNMPWDIMVDALYIDGEHTYTSVKSDFERFTPFLKPGGIVMMDDYSIIKPPKFEVNAYVNKELQDDWNIKPVENGFGVILWRK